MDKSNLITFPKKKLYTPAETEAVKDDEAHKIVMQLIEWCFIDDDRVSAFTRLRERAFDYADTHQIKF